MSAGESAGPPFPLGARSWAVVPAPLAAGDGGASPPESRAPQPGQKRRSAGFSLPQLGHGTSVASALPQLPQKFASSGLAWPQSRHLMTSSLPGGGGGLYGIGHSAPPGAVDGRGPIGLLGEGSSAVPKTRVHFIRL